MERTCSIPEGILRHQNNRKLKKRMRSCSCLDSDVYTIPLQHNSKKTPSVSVSLLFFQIIIISIIITSSHHQMDLDYDDFEDFPDPDMDNQGGGDGDEADEVLDVDIDDSTTNTNTSGKKLRWGRPEGDNLATTPSSTPDDLEIIHGWRQDLLSDKSLWPPGWHVVEKGPAKTW